jgi:hypothetical protein
MIIPVVAYYEEHVKLWRQDVTSRDADSDSRLFFFLVNCKPSNSKNINVRDANSRNPTTGQVAFRSTSRADTK